MKSASSTVEPPVARKLRSAFSNNASGNASESKKPAAPAEAGVADPCGAIRGQAGRAEARSAARQTRGRKPRSQAAPPPEAGPAFRACRSSEDDQRQHGNRQQGGNAPRPIFPQACVAASPLGAGSARTAQQQSAAGRWATPSRILRDRVRAAIRSAASRACIRRRRVTFRVRTDGASECQWQRRSSWRSPRSGRRPARWLPRSSRTGHRCRRGSGASIVRVRAAASVRQVAATRFGGSGNTGGYQGSAPSSSPARGGGRGRGLGAAGAFGRQGGKSSKARKNRLAKRQEFQEMKARSSAAFAFRPVTDRPSVCVRAFVPGRSAEKINVNPAALVTVLFHLGEMATATQSWMSPPSRSSARKSAGHQDRVREEEISELLQRSTSIWMKRNCRMRICGLARRSSPSWATSIMVRPDCSTPSAAPTSSHAKPAASRSVSVHTRYRGS